MNLSEAKWAINSRVYDFFKKTVNFIKRRQLFGMLLNYGGVIFLEYSI